MAPVPGKFVQIMALNRPNVPSAFLVALDINGLLWLLHIPWENGDYQAFVANPSVQQAPLPVVPGWPPAP